MLSDRIKTFNRNLRLDTPLPEGIGVMNPFQESAQALRISEQFYDAYYADDRKRYLILGINPGRLGAGATGVPFTDTKRLASACGLPYEGLHTHEPSSDYVYRMIDAYGGVRAFYDQFFINSISPLGFVKQQESGKAVNYNYYDSRALTEAVRPFIVDCLHALIDLGMYTDTVFCLGKGKNYTFLQRLNKELSLFGEVIPLEHPRFVIQYRRKQMDDYIAAHVAILKTQSLA